MTPAPRKLLVLSAGLSTPSSTRMLADQLVRSARRALEAAGHPVQERTIELREVAHDATDALLTHFPNERFGDLNSAIREADAVIAVTPVFNTGPSGLFKIVIDALDTELWRGKPVLLGATAGTARHSLTLEYGIRPIFQYLKAEVVPTGVFAASGDFGTATVSEADGAPLASRADRAGAELAALLGARAGAVAAAPSSAEDSRTAHESTDQAADGLDPEFADFVPMGQLLRH